MKKILFILAVFAFAVPGYSLNANKAYSNDIMPQFDKDALTAKVDLALANSTTIGEQNQEKFWDAVRMGDIATVKSLLNTGRASIDAMDDDGNTALFIAVEGDDYDMTVALLDFGAFTNARNNDNVTPLILACERNIKITIIEQLLMRGASANLKAGSVKKGLTPLMAAAANGNCQVINLLMKHGANPNISNIQGVSPLMFAAKGNHTCSISALLRARADIHAVDRDGDTPLIYAAKYGAYQAAETLIAAGADIKDVNAEGQGAAQIAAQAGFLELSHYLYRLQYKAEGK